MSVINTNIMSLNAQRHLGNSQSSMQTSMERLSSGLRINSAKDDAAGLAVGKLMSAQIASFNQGLRNANDGISMIQTAEGAMEEVQVMMERMKELATQAANSSISDTQRGYVNDELQALKKEISSIAERTTFNGQGLLDGSLTTTVASDSAVKFGAAVAGGFVAELDVSEAKAGKTYNIAADAGKVTLTDNADATITEEFTIEGALAAGESTTLEFKELGISLTLHNGTDTEIAADALASGLGANIKTAAGNSSATLQVGQSSSDTINVSFANLDIENGGLAGLNTALEGFDGSKTIDNAQKLMDAVDSAIETISGNRAQLGAAQNRLDHTISNIQTMSENLSAAKSQVMDADFAAETANLTRTQVLQQAGTAMLAQANQAPQNVLSLLR